MVTRRRFIVMLGVGLPAAAAAVAGIQLLPSEGPRTGNPAIRYGENTCVRCSMVISDPRYAAAWREESGREALFDDIGCMVHQDHDVNPRGASYFVHDNSSETWVDALRAAYLLDNTQFVTPMAYGIAAFETRAAASSMGTGNQVLVWAELKPALDGKVRHESLHR
jgi:copper chaperone NosL